MPNSDTDSLIIPGLPEIKNLDSLNGFRPNLEWVALAMSRRQTPEDLPVPPGGGTLFFLQGDPVLQIRQDKTPGQLEKEEGFFSFDREAFRLEKEEETLLFQAERSGYLAWGLKGLTLIDPTILQGDTKIIFRDLPLREGVGSLKNYLSSLARDHRRLYIHPDIHILTSESAALLVTGTPGDHILIESPGSVPGRDGSMKVLVHPETPQVDDRERVNFKDFHGYTVAQQGDHLVELHHPFPGKPGVNVFGVEYPVTPGIEIDFHAGENVNEVIHEGVAYFTATVDGLVQLKKNSVSVSETMIIHGDVDLKTGNIDFRKNVLIKGSVTENFSVTTGGDLIVEGLVGAGAKIECKGSLTVLGGIFGESTRVMTEKDGSVSFVQDARVYCEGSLTVMKYALNGHLFSGNTLSVLGLGLKSSRQAVEGGSGIAMRAINLVSAGSEMRVTKLTAGYNPYVEKALANIGEALGAVELQVTATMNRMGCGSDLSILLERIKRMQPSERKKIRENLSLLKEFTQKREELLAERNRKYAVLRHNDPERLTILVKGRLVPKVHIRMVDTTLPVEHPDYGAEFRLSDGTIVKK